MVFNPENKILFIERLGKWDLPKGKLEPNELPEQGALREIEEECSVSGLSIIKPLFPTYHCYVQKGKSFLKITYWFKILCTKYDQMRPQTKEGITQVRWFSVNELTPVLNKTYPNIKHLINEVLKDA